MLNEEKAEEFKRRREQCDDIASIASAGPRLGTGTSSMKMSAMSAGAGAGAGAELSLKSSCELPLIFVRKNHFLHE